MTTQDVLALLEEHKNERGIANWKKTGYHDIGSFGLGMTQLKALAKKIGKDHELALQLWDMPYFDTKVLATLVDNPKEVTPAQADAQMSGTYSWLLSHAYCSYLLPKASFLKNKVVEWTASDDDLKRRCGYLLLYPLAKHDKTLSDAFFEPYLDTIEAKLQTEENFVKDGMNTALLAIGQRSRNLNIRAIEVARAIGKVEVDYGDNSCETTDCLQHLTSERIQSKLG